MMLKKNNLDKLNEEDKERLYNSFKEFEEVYVKIGDKESFFINKPYEPRELSLLSRVYYTLIPTSIKI